VVAALVMIGGVVAEQPRAQDATVGLAVVTGRVVDGDSGEPVEGADVRLIGDEREFVRLSNDRGLFLFPRVPPGVYEVVLEHLSYGTRTDTIEVVGREIVDFEVRLAKEPIALAPLLASVRREYLSPSMHDFYERLQRGLGRFITRAEIELQRPSRITHMIASLPGIALIRGPNSVKPRLHFRRHQRYIPGRGAIPCWPTVYVDGRRVQDGGPDPESRILDEVEIDDLVLPTDIAGIEVYDGAGGIPARFGGSWGGCGVIAIWTRSAP
jgi:hypothetical protein